MKKIVSLVLSIVLLVGLIGCSSQKQTSNTQLKESDVREAVWNQLTSGDKAQIKGSWQDSKVSKIVLKENMGKIKDKSFVGKEVYIVDFTTNSVAIPNNMAVYASMDDYKLIGYGLAD